MFKKKIQIGLSDFKQLIQKNGYYIDKTSFIKELLAINPESVSENSVSLFCRPRRFGKTLNLSMLNYFFEKSTESHAYLFENLEIWQDERARKEQGQYPVIFLSFKDVKDKLFHKAYAHLCATISEEFQRHEQSLASILSPHEALYYQSIINQTADSIAYEKSLLFLSKLLHKKYNKKTIVLIDEYDTPLHAAYSNGYYEDMIDFIRTVFSSVLKDNKSLERSILTGILRTGKEGIFSDLNNLSVYTMLNNKYTDFFGFTKKETFELLDYYQLSSYHENLKKWYDGYQFGENTDIYNPWSILSFIDNQASFQPYWVNTSSNLLIKELLAKADSSTKLELELLLQDSSLEKTVEENFTFQNLTITPHALWSLLFFSGYLTYNKRTLKESGTYSCQLVIPNHEIKSLYKNLLESIFIQSFKNPDNVQLFLKALISGDTVIATELLQLFMLTSASYYDFTQDEPEKSYHLFVLGLLITLEQTYSVKSNRESGYGRYDIMLIPKNKNQPALIIEFKKAGKKSLEEACLEALEQIKEQKYISEIQNLKISTVIMYGIAFKGKEVCIKKDLD